MKQIWRWFSPDSTFIEGILQAGAEGVVSALHHILPGAIWSTREISDRKEDISRMLDGSPSGLGWDVAKSLPVSEAIKKQIGDWRQSIENYKISLKNLADQDIKVVCFNFMLLLDWTRTDLKWHMPHGRTTMRFDKGYFLQRGR